MTDSTWIGVPANLTAPAYHHDEVSVPLSREVDRPTTRFGATKGLPQPDEVASHHGQGPG